MLRHDLSPEIVRPYPIIIHLMVPALIVYLILKTKESTSRLISILLIQFIWYRQFAHGLYNEHHKRKIGHKCNIKTQK